MLRLLLITQPRMAHGDGDTTFLQATMTSPQPNCILHQAFNRPLQADHLQNAPEMASIGQEDAYILMDGIWDQFAGCEWPLGSHPR